MANTHVSEGPPPYRFEIVWSMLDDIIDQTLILTREEAAPVRTREADQLRQQARGIAMALAVWRCGSSSGELFDETVNVIREEAVDRWYLRRGL